VFVAYGATQKAPDKIEVKAQRKTLSLPKRKIGLALSVSSVQGQISLSAYWNQQAKDDEDLMLLL
jgi:hypothetical protein